MIECATSTFQMQNYSTSRMNSLRAARPSNQQIAVDIQRINVASCIDMVKVNTTMLVNLILTR